MGTLFFLATARDLVATLDTYGWNKVAAEVNSLSIGYPQKAPQRSDHKVFEFKAEYDYWVDGERLHGTSLRRKPRSSGSYHKLADLKADLIVNEVSHAYVDPDDPKSSILQHDSLWGSLIILFPIPFILIGVTCMAIGSGRFLNSGKEKKSYTSYAQKNSHFGVIPFGLIFTAIGIGFLFPTLISPFRNSRVANDWVEVPAEVIWSRVRAHDGEDTTYSIDVFYEYEFNNEAHRSNRYSFMGGSSSGSESKSRVVRNHPAGKKITCFVDPGCPRHAVIDRGTTQIGFWWLIPTVFVVVGLAIASSGFWGSNKKKSFFHEGNETKEFVTERTRTTNDGSSFNRDDDFANTEEDTKTLHVGGSRWLSLIGMICVAAFWNGIVGVLFVGNILNFFQGEKCEVFLLFFSLPFIIVGLLILCGVVHQFCCLFNPHITLRVTPGQPRTGGELLVEWEVQGGWTRIRQLQIALEGVEEAAYNRGTTRMVDEETFYRKQLVDEVDDEFIRSGSVVFELPLGLMPTLNLIDNDIVWRLAAEGTIPRWASIFDMHEIEIRPFSITPESRDSLNHAESTS